MGRTSKESSTLINSLQEELSRVTQSRNVLQQNIRKLEQENDTLEQRERYNMPPYAPLLLLTFNSQGVDCICGRLAR